MTWEFSVRNELAETPAAVVYLYPISLLTLSPDLVSVKGKFTPHYWVLTPVEVCLKGKSGSEGYLSGGSHSHFVSNKLEKYWLSYAQKRSNFKKPKCQEEGQETGWFTQCTLLLLPLPNQLCVVIKSFILAPKSSDILSVAANPFQFDRVFRQETQRDPPLTQRLPHKPNL